MLSAILVSIRIKSPFILEHKMNINSDYFANIHLRFGTSNSKMNLLPQRIIDTAGDPIIGGWRVWATGTIFRDQRDWEHATIWLSSALQLLKNNRIKTNTIFAAEVDASIGEMLFEEERNLEALNSLQQADCLSHEPLLQRQLMP